MDVSVCGFGFYLGFNTSLGVEVPKPFKIEGSVRLEVGFRVFGKKIKKSFTVEFKWEKSKDNSKLEIIPFDAASSPVKALNMMSNEIFKVAILPGGSTNISFDESNTTILGVASGVEDLIRKTIIPMDSYVDIELLKPVEQSALMDRLVGSAALKDSYIECIPPKKLKFSDDHIYSIQDLTIFSRADISTSTWQVYYPFQAMMAPEEISTVASNSKILGSWQILGTNYVRLHQFGFGWIL